MIPAIGDTISNRYTLIAQYRSHPGLSAWLANDHTLERDCQFYIISDQTKTASTAALASSLALSHDPHFTPVYNFARHDGVVTVVTATDQGISLHDFLHSKGHRPLSIEAIRTITAQITAAIHSLYMSSLSHQGLSSSVVRLTRSAITIADTAISPFIVPTAEVHYPQYKFNEEVKDISQIAKILFEMVTGTPFDSSHRTEMAALLAQKRQTVPPEFLAICIRALSLDDIEEGTSITTSRRSFPILTLTELAMLLGDAQKPEDLPHNEYDLPDTTGAPSISTVPMVKVSMGTVLEIPDSLQTEDRVESTNAPSQWNAGDLLFNGADAVQEVDPSSDQFLRSFADTNTGEQPIYQQPVQSGKTTSSSQSGPSAKSASSLPSYQPQANRGAAQSPIVSRETINNSGSNSDRTHTVSQTPHNQEHQAHQDAAASILPLDIPIPARPGTSSSQNADSSHASDNDETVIGMTPVRSGSQSGQSGQSRSGQVTPSSQSTNAQSANDGETTFIIPSNQAAKLKEAEDAHAERERIAEEQRQEALAEESAHTSTVRKSHRESRVEKKAKSEIKRDGSKSLSRTAIIWSGVILLVVILIIALTHLDLSPIHFGSSQNSTVWNIDSSSAPIPGGEAEERAQVGDPDSSQKRSDKNSRTKNGQNASTKPSPTDKLASAVPKPGKAKDDNNNKPLTLSSMQFFRAAQQDGRQARGIYIRLAQSSQVHRVEITMRGNVEGTNGELYANSTPQSPHNGDPIAKFTFQGAGKVTSISITDPPQTQDLVVWVPQLTQGGFYYGQVQVF
jgi:putative peptidoglycan lipid II flippase